jgi:hypothetical protein
MGFQNRLEMAFFSRFKIAGFSMLPFLIAKLCFAKIKNENFCEKVQSFLGHG